mgnify:FL=1
MEKIKKLGEDWEYERGGEQTEYSPLQKILNNPDYKLISQEMDNVVHSATKLRVECNDYREQLYSFMEFVQEELINPYDGSQFGSDVYRRARGLMKKSQEVIDFHDAN